MHTPEIVGFRLSPQQRRLWELLKDNHIYGVQSSLLLEGELQVSQLKEAVQAVVDRHEILRTSLCSLPECEFPLQVINEKGEPNWRVIDLSGLADATQIERIEEVFDQERSAAFELSADSPVRISLLTLSPTKHLLSISLPALCADARSLRNLTREIISNYAGSGPSDEPMQYADFAEWQNELLEGEEAHVGRAYWRDYWSKVTQDTSFELSLPFAERPTSDSSFLPASLRISVGPEILTNVDAQARACNSSA